MEKQGKISSFKTCLQGASRRTMQGCNSKGWYGGCKRSWRIRFYEIPPESPEIARNERRERVERSRNLVDAYQCRREFSFTDRKIARDHAGFARSAFHWKRTGFSPHVSITCQAINACELNNSVRILFFESKKCIFFWHAKSLFLSNSKIIFRRI